MFEFNGLIRLADGTTNDNCIKIISEEKGDATAVFVDALPRTKMEKIDFVKLSDPVPQSK